MTRRARLLACVLLTLVAVGTASCTAPAPVDEVGLYYNGGPIEGNSFERVVLPGSGTALLGPSDRIKWLPAGQRNYIVSKNTDEGDRQGSDFVEVPAKGGVAVQFEVSVYFKLNTSTARLTIGDKTYPGGILQRFWEEIGKRYGADTRNGWDAMLNDNFRKIIEASMRQKVFNYSVDELYANTEGEASGKEDAILQIQNEIATQIKENINQGLGGQYFCGPTFNRDRPDVCPDFQFIINSAEPPEAVRASFAAQRIAANEVVTAQNRAQAKAAEAEGTRLQQEALRGSLTPEYLDLQRIEALKLCAQNQSCTIVNGSGADVLVQPGSARGSG